MHPPRQELCAEHVRIALSLLGAMPWTWRSAMAFHTVTTRRLVSGSSIRWILHAASCRGLRIAHPLGGAAATIHPSQWFQLIAAGGSLFMAASARPQLPQRSPPQKSAGRS